jgi:hypothetical protein
MSLKEIQLKFSSGSFLPKIGIQRIDFIGFKKEVPNFAHRPATWAPK